MNKRLTLTILSICLSLVCFVSAEVLFAFSNEASMKEKNNNERIIMTREFSYPLISPVKENKVFQSFLVIRKQDRLITCDAGKSWIRQANPEPFRFFVVKRADGRLMKTDDGGFSWSYVSTNEGQRSPIYLFPNPASDKLQIVPGSSSEQLKAVKLYDMQGNIISKYFPGSGKDMAIDISRLQTGLYFILGEFESGNYVVTKFIKE